MGNIAQNIAAQCKDGYPEWVLHALAYERRIRRTRAFGIALMVVQLGLLALALWAFFHVEQYLESFVWAMVGNSWLIGGVLTYEQSCKTHIACSIAKHAYTEDDPDIRRILDM